jgi:hypothetical protein
LISILFESLIIILVYSLFSISFKHSCGKIRRLIQLANPEMSAPALVLNFVQADKKKSST